VAALVAAAAVVAGALPLLAATGAAAADPSCRALPVEADGPLRSALAREAFGVDGAGVTVGILSDSFDVDPAVTDAAQDVAAGMLPGVGNPCGYAQPVEVLVEGDPGGSDEGRAMAQVVHGIAPGARLVFAAAGTDQSAAIEALVAAHADVIVDDIWEAVEPVYQRGAVGTAVQAAVDAGVAYVAAAGNFTITGDPAYGSAGRPIGGWQTAAYRPTACPAEVVAAASGPVDCMDVDPGAGETAVNTVTMAAGGSATIVTQWGEPFGLVGGTAYTLWAIDADGSVRMQVPPIPDVPIGVGFLGNATPAVVETRLVISRALDGGTPAPTPVRWTIANNGPYPSILALEFDRSTGDDLVGTSMGGHAAYGAAIPVAAADWRTPDTVEAFSSIGPVTQLFGPQVPGGPPAAPLAEPIVVEGPAVAGVDGTRTTFFGTAPDHRFFGTSAASPSVAAVLALARQLAPDAGVAELRAAMAATAAPMANPYPDVADARVQGAGRVDALGLLTALAPAPTPAPDPSPAAPALLAASGAEPSPVLPVAGAAALALGALALAATARRRPRPGPRRIS
jgi:hypothetical protein